MAAWRDEAGLDNLLPPLELDVRRQPWPLVAADAVFAANMIHISPWESTRALVEGAAVVLAPGGVLAVYGPFRVGGRHTAPSNQAFDADLRARNPNWGVRDLEAVEQLAQAAGFDPLETVPMPANNLSVAWRRRSA
ncbi:MAG: class I SAM-dependent methyltransferase [Magnetospirillum sp.]|nr:class I SAM-dependent methyltransferase [Magnetospirillum sp.]